MLNVYSVCLSQNLDVFLKCQSILEIVHTPFTTQNCIYNVLRIEKNSNAFRQIIHPTIYSYKTNENVCKKPWNFHRIHFQDTSIRKVDTSLNGICTKQIQHQLSIERRLSCANTLENI